MNRIRTQVAVLTTVGALGVGGAAAAHATEAADQHTRPTALADSFGKVTGKTDWQLTSKLKLNFPTYHTEGIAFTKDHIFLSSVQILEPTVEVPHARRAATTAPPARASATCSSWTGRATCRRTSSWARATCTTRAASTSTARTSGSRSRSTARTRAPSSTGSTPNTGRPQSSSRSPTTSAASSWTSRPVTWSATPGDRAASPSGTCEGKQLKTWENPNFVLDYQDCQYVPASRMLCAGVTNLPQTPTAGGAAATYELGGIAMIDLRSHQVTREIPFQKWSTAGHVATRNPFKMTARATGSPCGSPLTTATRATAPRSSPTRPLPPLPADGRRRPGAGSDHRPAAGRLQARCQPSRRARRKHQESGAILPR